ncbi:hypothetical protein AOC10_01830 [Polynucleobacter asymbioticus]|uniref:hypothetical protein n=1 Tax=Polynucleobacter asymbioticus TaxID=576611 RepID=UPI0008FB0CAD|nr:hypothetical protein [Polynucleobacter asymbioticus]APC05356.1 hypothetical protein AOC10_01830 [Polynucleobacter asymbioticus]
MTRNSLIAIIAFTLIAFILFKGVASLLCDSQQANPVANVISNVIPTPQPVQNPAKQDPLSWDPVLLRLASFFSKACPL